MAKGQRLYARIDVGYTSNPKWFRLQRAMLDAMPGAMPDALLDAMREAMHAHLESVLYCFEHRTDGTFPVAAIKVRAQVRREEAITALFDVNLWENLPGGMANVHDYLQHQLSAEELDAASTKAKKAANARWGNASSNASSNAPSNAPSNARREEKRREENSNSRGLPEWANRTDIQEILDYLDAALKEAEIPLPSRTKTNLTAARLLIDKDGHTVDQVKAAIDFTFQDEFWRTNIRSMSKLREKWVQLRGAAQRKMPQAPQKPAVPDPYAYLEVSPPLARGGSNG